MGKMAGAAGLEPVTSAVTGQRSNQLSYTPAPKTGAQYVLRAADVNALFPGAPFFGAQTVMISFSL